jgi:hypothetical protein
MWRRAARTSAEAGRRPVRNTGEPEGVGDVVCIPPGVKHWHGAAATSGMTHIAVSEALDGKTVEWMEHVSDEQYRH